MQLILCLPIPACKTIQSVKFLDKDSICVLRQNINKKLFIQIDETKGKKIRHFFFW